MQKFDGIEPKLTEDQKRLLRLLEDEEVKIQAREDFGAFIRYMMPDPQDYADVKKTKYVSKPVHELMRRWWTELATGLSLRSALSVPPQTGKTLHTTILGVAWALGRNPELKIMIGTYNETKARQNGMWVRRTLESQRYKEIFPEVVLEKGGKSKAFLATDAGGYVLMAGRGTGITGNPCDVFLVDDPIKDIAEAQSTSALEDTWAWFTATVQQRMHNLSRIGVIHTRWADNDLIGRLCDPAHPEYSPERAAPWTWLNVRAYNNDPNIAEIMGIAPEDYIWPEKFSPELLAQIQQTMSPEAFSALYMGRPVPEEGGFFKKEMIKDYNPSERPELKDLTIYAASDHAVTTKSYSDYTVLVVAGVDKLGQVWILELVRRKMETPETVEEMLRLMRTYRPVTWFAARDQISKSIGPFLKNRMRSEGVYGTYVEDSPEIGNKIQKAQSIRAMMAIGLVRFPARTPWYSALVSELLRFRGEGDAHDDQVDALGHLGRGLERMGRRQAGAPDNDNKTTKFGTYGWLKGDMAAKKADEAMKSARFRWQ